LIFLAPARRPDAALRVAVQPLVHAAGGQWGADRRAGRGAALGDPAGVEATGGATFLWEAEPRLELAFDGERQGGSADFLPRRPLVFHWSRRALFPSLWLVAALDGRLSDALAGRRLHLPPRQDPGQSRS
jgi:hypothetical protein